MQLIFHLAINSVWLREFWDTLAYLFCSTWVDCFSTGLRWVPTLEGQSMVMNSHLFLLLDSGAQLSQPAVLSTGNCRERWAREALWLQAVICEVWAANGPFLLSPGMLPWPLSLRRLQNRSFSCDFLLLTSLGKVTFKASYHFLSYCLRSFSPLLLLFNLFLISALYEYSLGKAELTEKHEVASFSWKILSCSNHTEL